ncbi:MAG: cobalamin-binding protein [Gemmatimonadetes bacterium]|nr:cobalamin-binding protein [Gemmatimonadota bacterium]
MVSLIASGTEIVDGLGMGSTLIGVSHECDYPPFVRALPSFSRAKVDATATSFEIDADVRALAASGEAAYELDVSAIEEARPDVVVTQDVCDVCAVALPDVSAAVGALELSGTAVCPLTAVDLDGVFADYVAVARALGVPERGERLAARVADELDDIRDAVAGVERRPRVAFVEWLDPPMIGGGWIPELAFIGGVQPVIIDRPARFVTVDWEDVAAEDPDFVAILPCGFTTRRGLAECREPSVLEGLRSVRAVREGRCIVFDGHSYFNRPGPRLAEGVRVMVEAIHGIRVPGPPRSVDPAYEAAAQDENAAHDKTDEPLIGRR